eukprot:gene5561-11191_t
MVLTTIYRLPNLILKLLNTMLLSRVSGTETGTGPRITFKIQRNITGRNSNNSTAAADGGDGDDQLSPPLDFDVSAPVEFHLSGEGLWQSAAKAFGSMVVTAAKTMLPLKLKDGVGVNISELIDQLWMIQADTGNDRQTDGENVSQTLWIQLDLGHVKRSTIIKKLQKLNGNAVVVIQLETRQLTTNTATATAIPSSTPSRNASSSSSSSSKVVLVRIQPTVQQLITAMQRSLAELPVEALSATTTATTSAASSTLGVATPIEDIISTPGYGLVDSFYALAGMECMSLLYDILHLALFIIICMNPFRLIRLLVLMFERESYMPVRIAEHCIESITHADNHLLEYKKNIFPVLNSYIKNMNSKKERNRTLFTFMRSSYFFHDYHVIQECDEAEKIHLFAYQRLCTQTQCMIDSTAGCEKIAQLIRRRIELQNDLIRYWTLKCAASMKLNDVDIRHEHAELLVVVLSEDYDRAAEALRTNGMELETELASMRKTAAVSRGLTVMKKEEKGLNRLEMFGWVRSSYDCVCNSGCGSDCGLLTRSVSATRKLVQFSFVQTILDFAFAALLLLLVLSMFRTLPLLDELLRSRSSSSSPSSFCPTIYGTRAILTKHLMRLWRDICNFTLFVLYTLLIIVTVVGIPSYLEDLSKNLSSLERAQQCAKEHFFNTLWYILELLSFMFVVRTYRIAVKAAVYSFLVPAACLGESVIDTQGGGGCSCFTTISKFIIGVIVWLALLGGAIAVTVFDQSVGTQGVYTDVFANSALLYLCAAVLLILLWSTHTVSSRGSYLTPNVVAVNSPKLSWSHVLALLTGPLEAIQLSAIVIFFFWEDTSTANLGSSEGTFASQLMVWGDSGGGPNGYYDSTFVAIILVMIWAVVITLPLAVLGKDGGSCDRRRVEKALSFKNSSLYEVTVLFLSRLFVVWIMASLMRCSSCIPIQKDDTDTVIDAGTIYVMSTSYGTRCGGGGSWVSLASLPLLMYFIVTSSVLHADDADLLQIPSSNLHSVKFTPLYTLCVRMSQVFICAACMGGFWAPDVSAPLIPVLIVSGSMALLPIFFSDDVCSFAAVVPLRSAGWVCVLWSGIACHYRQTTDVTLFESHTSVLVGWAVIYVVAIVIAVFLERLKFATWKASLIESGLELAIGSLVNTFDTLSTDEVLFGKRNSLINHRIKIFRDDALHTQSPPQLALMLLSFEELMLAERFSSSFLEDRSHWRSNLEEIFTDSFYQKNITADQIVHTEIITEDNNHVNGAILEVVGIPSQKRAFDLIVASALSLSAAIRPKPTVCMFSKEVLAILLSRQLPLDVSWYIFSFTYDMESIRFALKTTGIPNMYTSKTNELLQSDIKHFTVKLMEKNSKFIDVHV